jgi:hypothetical protein
LPDGNAGLFARKISPIQWVVACVAKGSAGTWRSEPPMEPTQIPDDISVTRLSPPMMRDTEALARSAERLREERRRLDEVLAAVERDLGDAQIRVAKLEARFERARRRDLPIDR